MMNHQGAIEALRVWLSPVEADDRIIINSLSVYPSNAIAKIAVQPMMDSYIVSDEAGAYNCIASSGSFDANIIKSLKKFCNGTDFQVAESGSMFIEKVELSALTAAASLVAEHSIEAAKHLIKKLRPVSKTDFRPEFRQWVEETFKNRIENPKLAGASNKVHRFDYQIRLGESLMLLDAVRPDHGSIASKVVAHLDIANRQEKNIKQAIVYDAEDDWAAADLSLLRVGATPVEFTSLGQYILEATE